MSEPASPRSVLITGAAGGLGQGLVRSFSSAAWRVAAGVRTTPLPPGCEVEMVVPLEVRSAESVRAAAEMVGDRFAGLDCLVLNAGSLSNGLMLEMKPQAWDEVIDVHLNGARLCAQHFLPLLMKKAGHLLFISSFVARSGARGQANYGAAKAGMIGLAQSIARECGPSGVRANVVFPGLLPTGMTAPLSRAEYAEKERANVLGHTNTIEEVSAFAAHLAGMRGVSGQVFQLDSRIARWC